MKPYLILLLFFTAFNVFAVRGYVGNQVVTEVRFTYTNSNTCGGTSQCLMLYFENGAHGCTPESDYLSFPLDHPNIKSIESMAYMSLSTGLKMRVWGTKESCSHSQLLSPGNVSLYKTAN